ncbi:uncharacterized protein BN786_00633 [Clostridium sp. CAG:793]|jgi:hypothetical protein|nr:uncharacterized protein BN786_00633 [Clostridium sp. CAG:793]
MKFFDKLGLAIFSAIVLIISITLCLIGFGWIEPSVYSILISKAYASQTGTYVLIGSCTVLALLAIKCLFFTDMTSKDDEEEGSGILLQNEDGRLLITADTLRNMVEGVITDFDEITDSITRINITKENDVIIEISIDVLRGTVIKDVTSRLQTKVKKEIKAATDLEIKYVNVKVRNTGIEKADEDKEKKTKATKREKND